MDFGLRASCHCSYSYIPRVDSIISLSLRSCGDQKKKKTPKPRTTVNYNATFHVVKLWVVYAVRTSVLQSPDGKSEFQLAGVRLGFESTVSGILANLQMLSNTYARIH